jgi:hypothetical protein
MHRRKFIRISGSSVAAVSFFSFPITGCSSRENKYALLEDFMPKETIMLIGNEYLQKNSSFADQNYYSNLSKKETEELVEKDFEDGRIVIVSGWVLSITEAKRCGALVKTIKNAH